MRLRFGLSVVLAGLFALAAADNAVVVLSSFPTAAVADGRSTVTLKAEVRDTAGRLVPDGTRVVFTTNSGVVREPVVSTKAGIARTVLVAPSNAGVAQIVANVLNYNATTTFEFEFVRDRSLLSSATEYIEVVAPNDLVYSMDYRTIGASGLGRKAVLRYRDIEVRADDLQLNIGTLELRAKNAALKWGAVDSSFGQLYLKLSTRTGFGTTTYTTAERKIVPVGRLFQFVEGAEREAFGTRELSASGLKKPESDQPQNAYEFAEISESTQMIGAKKAVVYQGREIQFHKADIFVSGAKVLSVPLFQLPTHSSRRLVMDDILNVANNSLSINYPYYLSLKPGQTSLLRFRTGQLAGRGVAVNRGIFLDYELNWNKGDDMRGDISVQGIGRSDWGIAASQSFRFGDSTTLDAQIELPSHRSVFGNVAMNRQFSGFQVNLNANTNHSIAGTPFSGRQASLSVEAEPISIKGLPIRFGYGVSANHDQFSAIDSTYEQNTLGMNTRFFTPLISLGRKTSFNGDLSISKLVGSSAPGGLSYIGSLGLSHRVSNEAFMLLTYNYFDNGFSSGVTGRHLLGLRSQFGSGPFWLQLQATKGLDVDRTGYLVDASYRLNNALRLSYSYTYDRFFGQGFTDYNIVLGYRLGFREFGIVWSHSTKRLGIQYLGTSFN